MTIERVAFNSAESKELMAELWREVDLIYGNREPSQPALDGMEGAGAAFFVARENGEAIGCIALRPLTPEIAEVKRMYVRPAARGAGVARALMQALEETARASAFHDVWLETGLGQPAAIRLYENLGYKRIASFGDYAHDPVSVCYGKRLL